MNDSIIPGVFYVKIGDKWEKLGEMADTPEVEPTDEPEPCDLSKLTEELSVSFEMVGKMAEQAALMFFGLWDEVLKSCPDPRVRHLALHAKRERTRKKNIHRIFRMIERRKVSDLNEQAY